MPQRLFANCSVCDTVYKLSKQPTFIRGTYICDECMDELRKELNQKEEELKQQKKKTYTCFECGKVLEFPQEIYGSEHPYCYQCFKRQQKTQEQEKKEIPICTDCGIKMFTQSTYWHRGKSYCGGCFEKYASEYEGNWYYDPGYQDREPHSTYSNAQQKQEEFDFEFADEFIRRFFGQEQFRNYRYSGSSSSSSGYSYTHSFNRNTSSVPQTVSESFRVLGLAQTANVLEIKKAWKQLALKYHPDINKEENAHQEMVKLNRAKEICLQFAGSK